MEQNHLPRPKTIVHVDNDPLFLHAIRDILESNGYKVFLALDGLEGLALIRDVKPDYVILDVVMPKLDGGMLCTELRRDASVRHTPLIVFSSLAPGEYRHFPRLIADAFVAKGPLEQAAANIVKTLRQFDTGGLETAAGSTAGFEGLQAHRLDSELLLDRAFLKAILQAIPPGAMVLDLLGNIITVNPGAVAMLGVSASSLVGQPLSALVTPGEWHRLQELLAELVRSHEPTQERTLFHVEGLWVSAHLAPVLENQGCLGFLVVLEKAVNTAGLEVNPPVTAGR